MESWIFARYRLMMSLLRLLGACCPYGLGNQLAARGVHLLHPLFGERREKYLAGLAKALGNGDRAEKSWRLNRRLTGVSQHQLARYLHADVGWIDRCELAVKGGECLRRATEAGRGTLVMTYHHHLNFLFCSLLGRLGHPLTVIAMDPRESFLFQRFSGKAKRVYSQAARHFNGGAFAMVSTRSQMRPVFRALEQNHLVVSVNDFPDPFAEKNRLELPFLNSALRCPTGTVKLALRKRLPVVAAYLLWRGGSRFELVIEPISQDAGQADVQRIMTAYLGVLEKLVSEEAGRWEGWDWVL